MNPKRRAIFINSIKFYDNEVLIEGEEEVMATPHPFRDFRGSAQDLLHQGNVDGVLLLDEEKGRLAYNDKLLKYNSKYAQLIAKQKSNVEGIEKLVSTLPHIAFVDELNKDVQELNNKQLSFIRDFEEFRRLIQDVTNRYLSLRQARGGDI